MILLCKRLLRLRLGDKMILKWDCDNIYVNNDDKLCIFLLDMDTLSGGKKYHNSQTVCCLGLGRQSTCSFPTAKHCLSCRWRKLWKWGKRRVEGNEGDDESELAVSSKDEETFGGKKVNTMSILWKWFGYLRGDVAQIKMVCKICCLLVLKNEANVQDSQKLQFL